MHQSCTKIWVHMPTLRSRSYVAQAGKFVSEVTAPKQPLQPGPPSGPKSEADLSSSDSARSPGSKKRARAAIPSASASVSAASKLPDKPVAVKKLKVRKALLKTLWSTEELVPLKAKAEQLYNQLNQLYTNPPCPLDYTTPFQLLVAVILSAQTRRSIRLRRHCSSKHLMLMPWPTWRY
ncbi:alpha,alpha-trehalase nth1, variant 2 [Trebouxia sp. C0010 RCD-2024]